MNFYLLYLDNLISDYPPHDEIYRNIMANYVKSTPVHNFVKVITVDTSFRLYQILSLVSPAKLLNLRKNKTV